MISLCYIGKLYQGPGVTVDQYWDPKSVKLIPIYSLQIFRLTLGEILAE